MQIKPKTPIESFSEKWTEDIVEEIKTSGVDDSIVNAINNEIINSIAGPKLLDRGWFYVCSNQLHEDDIKEWVTHNIKHPYRAIGNYWYFQSETDSVLFSLTWNS